MGQLQNAFNAGVGSIIASKAMAEHLQSQALNAVESQYDQAKKLGKDAEPIAKQINEQAKQQDASNKFFKEFNEKWNIERPRDEKTGRFVNKNEYRRKLDNDMKEAYQSLLDLHKQQRATAAQAQDFQARLNMFKTRQDLIQKSIDRLPANKRPESLGFDKLLSKDQRDAINTIEGKINKENK